jgi:hypothetical protein
MRSQHHQIGRPGSRGLGNRRGDILGRRRRVQQTGFDLEPGRLNAVARLGEELLGGVMARLEEGVDIDGDSGP